MPEQPHDHAPPHDPGRHHDPGHSGPDEPEHIEGFGQGFWDDRYRSAPALWSGHVNRYLAAEVADLPAGRALDVGCGEGGDALWLAEHGWRVTAVDVSTVALERAAGHAAERGAELAGRISWQHRDFLAWDPEPAAYDLVSAQYLHPPSADRPGVFGRLAAAVAPGGSLLVVGHHPSDLQTSIPRPPIPELFFVGADVGAVLEPGEWTVVTDAAPGRTATDPDGRTVTIHDTVFRARRGLG